MTGSTILIRNGTVVSSTGATPMDVLVDGETIAALYAPGARQSARHRRRPGDRRHRQVRHPGRHRRPHPHGDALRRDHVGGHVRDRDPGRGLGRHHDDHRLRHPSHRRAGPGHPGPVARQGRGQLRHRLRLPPDHRRGGRRRPQGHGRTGRPRGRHQLQAVHGLPGRVLLRRRPDPAGHAEGGRHRRHDHDARRERHRHRRAGRPDGQPGRDRPGVPRPEPAVGRSRARPPIGRACWPAWRATSRSTSCTCRRPRRSRRWPRPATAAPTCSPRPAPSTST